MDWHMPGLDGLETSGIIKRNDRLQHLPKNCDGDCVWSRRHPDQGAGNWRRWLFAESRQFFSALLRWSNCFGVGAVEERWSRTY